MSEVNGNPKADGLRERVEGDPVARPDSWCITCRNAVVNPHTRAGARCPVCRRLLICIAWAEQHLGVVVRDGDYIIPDQDQICGGGADGSALPATSSEAVGAATRLWIVGKMCLPYELRWEFQGVFDSEALADCACRTAAYFMGPATLNESLPDEPSEWPGVRYPRLEEVQ